MTEDNSAVVDDHQHHRFVSRQDGIDAQLVCRTDGDRLILVHTEVPDVLSGRGIGGRLVQAAVDRAAATGEILVPWCPYARKWLADRPDLSGRVGIDWDRPAGAGENDSHAESRHVHPKARRPSVGEDLRLRSPAEVFDDHLRLAGEHRFEEDIERNVAPDCVIFERRGVFHGRDGARHLARLLAEELPGAPYAYTNRLVGGRGRVLGVDFGGGARPSAGRG